VVVSTGGNLFGTEATGIGSGGLTADNGIAQSKKNSSFFTGIFSVSQN
jgi:hypothetical protein